MSDIVLYDKFQLTDEQDNCVHLLALDISVPQVSKMTKIPADRIRLWLQADVVFQAALKSAAEQKAAIIQRRLDQAGILATDYAIDILSNQVEPDDIEGRRIQKDIAKSILGILSSKKVEVKLTAPENQQLDNIDDASKKIVAQYSQPDTPSYIVLDNTEILADEPILFKGCVKGVLNTDPVAHKIQCHICGKWYEDFVVHIRKSHAMSPGRYRAIYEIPDDVSFFIEDIVDANDN